MDTISREAARRPTTGGAAPSRSVAKRVKHRLGQGGGRPEESGEDWPDTVPTVWSETVPAAQADEDWIERDDRGAADFPRTEPE